MQDEDVLERLTREVLTAGLGASLPSRLSDEWLELASRSIDEMLNGQAKGDAASHIGMMLVLKILADKDPAGKPPLEIPLQTLHEYLEAYRLELSLQKLTRAAKFRATPATLDTIFDLDRQVEVTQLSQCSMVEGSDSVQ